MMVESAVPVSRGRVMIVEDEFVVAQDMEETLKALGFHLAGVAGSGDEAMSLARRTEPDVVLMDIRIRGPMDGIQTAQALRDELGIPVVYLTAHADDGTLARARETEPLGFLVKPVRQSELLATVEMSLTKHRADQRARERERWLLTTLRCIADGVVAVDRNGRVVLVNHAAHKMLGQSEEELRGTHATEVLAQHPEAHADAPAQPLQWALENRTPVLDMLGELQASGTGRTFPARSSVAPVLDAQRLLGAVLVFRDETEARHLRQQAEVNQRLAALGTLAAGVAHEVNNPLTTILLNCEVMTAQATEGGPEAAEGSVTLDAQALGDVKTAALRIRRIVDDLRVFSFREAPQPNATCNPVEVIQSVVRLTLETTRSRARVVADVAPCPRVAMEDARLAQVLTNLLVNAALAIEPDHPEENTITVRAFPRDGVVVLEVADTGKGMDAATAKRVFEPFFTTRPVGQGTGLGLSICHSIVTSAGGGIRVHSRPGAGTTFTVVVPWAPLDS